MIHRISSDRISIGVQSTGAELCSLIDRRSGREFIWQADPAVWGSHAPVLFPNIGVVKNGTTEIDGREYALPKHGIIRRNDALELYGVEEDRLALRLVSGEQTKRVYPYDFEFRITFRLRNEHLIVYHEVTNTDDRPIHFCLGGHPAFRVPHFEGDRYEDYLIRFEHAEDAPSLTVTDEGTLSEKTRPVPWAEGGTVLPLTHDLFANDALVFKDLNSRSVILESRQHGPFLKVDYAGWPYLGIWAKPDGDFVCVEPWIGHSDMEDGDGVFLHKDGIVTLAPGSTYEMSYDLKLL